MVILFDLDDTLVDSKSAHIYAINKICQKHFLIEKEESKQIAQNWISIRNKNLQLYFERKISLNQHRLNSIIEFWKINNIEISRDNAQNVYRQYHLLLLQSCKVFPDVLPTLTEFKNHQLGIISNGIYSDQVYKLKLNGLHHFFKKIIVPDHIGFAKPSKEIFFAAQNSKPHHQTVFILEILKKLIIWGGNAGMKAFYLIEKIIKI